MSARIIPFPVAGRSKEISSPALAQAQHTASSLRASPRFAELARRLDERCRELDRASAPVFGPRMDQAVALEAALRRLERPLGSRVIGPDGPGSTGER